GDAHEALVEELLGVLHVAVLREHALDDLERALPVLRVLLGARLVEVPREDRAALADLLLGELLDRDLDEVAERLVVRLPHLELLRDARPLLAERLDPRDELVE